MHLISHETVEKTIFTIRNKKVMLDADLARLYGVETKALNRAVLRNLERFPDDFMFQLKPKEADDLRCQFGTSKRGGRRYLPYVFTEHGILMLSSVLNSSRAIQVNIQIMRIYMKMREMALSYKDLIAKIDEMEKKYDKQFQVVFKAIKLLLEKPKAGPPKRFE
ncbi:MAG: ORF6N domain-containing protein [Candidatus Omnitrophota bacterium]